MKRVLIGLLFLGLVTGPAGADEASHRKAAEKLLLLFDTDKTIEAMFDQMVNMQKQQLQAQGVVDAEEAFMIQEKMYDVLEDSLKWENIKEDYIDIYTKHFTEDQLNTFIEFFSSDAGQLFIDKQQNIVVESMQVGQKYGEKAVPKIQEVLREELQKLEEEENGEGYLSGPDAVEDPLE